MNSSPSPAHSDRLETWKAIANYLHRDVRTVQRWERAEGLPVHRHEHTKQATVYAYPDEIDAWLAARAPDSREPLRWVRHAWRLAAAIALVALILWGAISLFAPRPHENRENIEFAGETSRAPSIVVLPFEHRSDDETLAYFSAGITDDIINLLAAEPELQVTSRTSSTYLYEQGLDLPEIARRLSADMVLEGAVRREGEQVHVTANLVEAATNTPVDSFRFDRSLDEVLDIQSEIAAGVVRRLSVSLQDVPRYVRRTESLRAEQLYLRARFENRKRTATSMNVAIELLEQAIQLDPRFAAAYAELAMVNAALPGYSQREPDRLANRFPQAIQAARKALELDPTLSTPHAILAGKAAFEMDYLSARAGFERALELSPNDPVIRVWFGMLLSGVGDNERALEQFARAHRVDPLSAMTNRFMGIALRRLGRDDGAMEYLDTAIELGGVNARYVRALEFIDRKQFGSAVKDLEIWARNHGIDPGWAAAYVAARRDPAHREAAVTWIRRLEPLHRDIGPTTYASIGALDEAFASARSQIESGIASFLFVEAADPEMKAFRSDPRFAGLVRQTGLIAYWHRYGWNGYCQRSGERLTCA